MKGSFIGNIEAKVDVKGRVFIPSSYRKLLPEGEKEWLVMRKDPDHLCLILYPESVWNKKLETLKMNLDEWKAEDQLLLSQFLSDADWVELDSQGRVLINKKYLQQIEVEADILFVGLLDRIAVWKKTNYEKRKLSSEEFAKKLSEKMTKKSGGE